LGDNEGLKEDIMRKTTASRAAILLTSVLVLWITGALPALGKPVLANYIKSTATADGDFKLYDYTAAVGTKTYTSQADFASGTTVNTSVTSTPGSVAVDPTGSTWLYKRCYTVTHTLPGAGTVGEYPISITLDTATLIAAGKMQASGADIRAVAASGAQMPLWIEGLMNTTTTVIWVQVAQILGGGSVPFCLYYGNPLAATVSDPLAPFTYSVPKPVYYPVSNAYATAPTTVSVASFGPNNVVTIGGTTINLPLAGSTGTFPSGVVQSTLPVNVLGPLNAKGVGTSYDALAPVAFAGTKFVNPLTFGGALSISVLSPFANATVVVKDGVTPVAGSPFSIPAGTSITVSNAFTANSSSAVITSDVPVLVSSVTTTGTLNSIPISPSTETWFGVRNQYVDYGFGAAGSLTARYSNGTSITLSGTDGADVYEVGSGSSGGSAAEGMAVTGTVPISVFADSGADAATFLPRSELSTQYVLPTAATYVTFSCPVPGTVIQIGAITSVTCTTTGAGPFPAGTPGKAVYAGAVPAGTIIKTASVNTFYMYYADTGRETNAWGPKHSRQVVYPAPVLGVGVESPLVGGSTVGTWTSPVIDTAVNGVFGTISWNATQPSGTTVNFRVAGSNSATGPWTYIGPDGSAATSYASSPGGLPFAHDGLRYFRIQLTLISVSTVITPLLNDVTVKYNLPRLAHAAGTPSSVTISAPAGLTTTAYLVRVKSASPAFAGSTATLKELGTSTLLSSLTANVRLDYPLVNQIAIVAAVVTPPGVGSATVLDATSNRSIVVTAQPAAGPSTTSTIRTRLVLDVGPAGGSPLIENDLDLQVVS
jgi:Domain of unknown function (DUF2341)